MCLNVMMVDGQNSFTFTQKWPTFCFDLLKLCIYLTLKIIAKKTFLQPHPLFSKVNQKKLSKGESNNICAMFFKQFYIYFPFSVKSSFINLVMIYLAILV